VDKHFLAIINENQKLILKVCHTYCSCDEDRHDLFQEILIHLWKGFPSFRGDAKISTWIYRVALNTAITFFKRSKRCVDTRPINDELLNIKSADSYDKLTHKDQVDYAFRAINKLSKIERAIIMLHLEEYENKEIADIIGITQNHVRVKLSRIKQKLRNTLIQHGYGY